MNDSTVAALNRINRRFYRQFADAFGATRSHPWPGWDRAISERCHETTPREEQCESLAILDVGCGNGRFAEYLCPRLDGRLRYFGMDESPEMLDQARLRLSALESVDFQLRCCNLIEGTLDEVTRELRFDVVVVFGLLHHIPGIEQRQRLLHDLTEVIEPGGLLLLSFWQFGEQKRFRRRFLDWSEHNRTSDEIIDLDQIEEGDYLLAWGANEDPSPAPAGEQIPRRFCHHATEEEAQRLVDGLEMTLRESFRSDGRSSDLNLYFVLEKPADSGRE